MTKSGSVQRTLQTLPQRRVTAFAGAKRGWAWLFAAVLLPVAAWGQTISFLPLATSFSESATNAVVTLIRSPVTGVASVSYTTTNGTATAGQDFVAVSGTLTFANGEGSKTILIPILEDLVAEAPETFFFVLSNPSGATLATNVLALTIQDNDTAFQFSLNKRLRKLGLGRRRRRLIRAREHELGRRDPSERRNSLR